MSKPLASGSATSSRTTCGRSSRVTASAEEPSSASPMTSNPSSASEARDGEANASLASGVFVDLLLVEFVPQPSIAHETIGTQLKTARCR